MELPQIGKQCSVLDCKQLDFLPLQCECKLFFCREHFTQHTKSCSAKITTQNTNQEGFVTYLCSKDGCNEKSIVPLICGKCNQHFCVSHRHITSCEEVSEEEKKEALEKYNAPKRQFVEAKAKVDKQIEDNIRNAKRKDKNVGTANKVQLMRLKGKATGMKTIPTADRIYFTVFNEKYCLEGKAVFVSRDWTVGRIIDAISAECSIPNSNNVAAAAKLRLFRKADNEILSNVMSDKIESLLNSGFIVNGDSLNLNFVTNVCKNVEC